ncbi:MAG TPA: iron-containing alcohol dehydrogenase, partial [Thermoplasmata archaeon]|nr:iron-containing alcohol dehydrogenase [Thermoplasmata archaeon]
MPDSSGGHASPTLLDSPFGKARSMVFPRTILAGHGVLAELGRSCRGFDFPERGSVITGPKTAGIAGTRAVEILTESKFDVTTIVAHEATPAEVDRVEAEAKSARALFLVAVGGGSKIDITKVTAHRLRIPFVSV